MSEFSIIEGDFISYPGDGYWWLAGTEPKKAYVSPGKATHGFAIVREARPARVEAVYFTRDAAERSLKRYLSAKDQPMPRATKDQLNYIRDLDRKVGGTPLVAGASLSKLSLSEATSIINTLRAMAH